MSIMRYVQSRLADEKPHRSNDLLPRDNSASVWTAANALHDLEAIVVRIRHTDILQVWKTSYTCCTRLRSKHLVNTVCCRTRLMDHAVFSPENCNFAQHACAQISKARAAIASNAERGRAHLQPSASRRNAPQRTNGPASQNLQGI